MMLDHTPDVKLCPSLYLTQASVVSYQFGADFRPRRDGNLIIVDTGGFAFEIHRM